MPDSAVSKSAQATSGRDSPPRGTTRTISVRLPELVFTGLEEAAGLNGHTTITEAVNAAVKLYIEHTVQDESALNELLSRRENLRKHLDALNAAVVN